MMNIRILFAFIVILTQIPGVYAEEEYNHVLTLESPNPEHVAWYGYGVDISGDIIAISEPFANVDEVPDAGKVYIYDLEGTLLSTLQSPTPGSVEQFGRRFDVHGDTVIVRTLTDIGSYLNAGKAHVFNTDGTYRLSLQSPEPTKGGYFGGAKIHDNIIVIYEDTNEGRVYLYDNELEILKTLYSPTPIVGGKFGRTMKVSETLILLSECGNGNNPMGPGSVHVFNHDGDHLMTLQAPEPEDYALFGASISISGDLIVIGESFATVGEVFRAGRAYIYTTDGEHLQTLQSPKPKMNGNFGDSVAIDSDRVVVGEWGANVNPFQYEGRAYVFDVEGHLLQNLTSPDPCPRAAFGLDVDIDGDTIVIGESWADIEDVDQVGRAHVYRLGPPVEAQEPEEEPQPVAEEMPAETEGAGGIPGFTALALVIGLMCTMIFLERQKR
jgi:hypothetical protein